MDDRAAPVRDDLPLVVRALVECVRGEESGSFEPLVLETIEAGEDLLQACIDHWLHSALYVELKRRDLLEALPALEGDRLRRIHARLVMDQDYAIATALEAIDQLQAAGVESVLPIKGTALLAHWWPSYLPRYMQDIDLLLPPAQMELALRVMDDAGFAAQSDTWTPTQWGVHAPRLARGDARIELHWALWPPSAMQPFALPTHADLTNRSVTRSLHDTDLRVPSIEDCFIIQAAALAVDGFSGGLIRWADLYWLLARDDLALDWGRLHDIIGELRNRGLIDSVMGFLRDLFGCESAAFCGWEDVTEDRSAEFQDVLRERLCEVVSPPVPGLLLLERPRGAAEVRDTVSEGLPDWLRPKDSRAASLSSLVGGPAAAAYKTLRYVTRLLLSGKCRASVRQSITLCRHMRRLAEQAEAVPDQ